MLQMPFFTELNNARNILLAGAGGGFDIFSGLPLFFGLKNAGKKVYLANLSFSFLPPPEATKEERLSSSLCRVTAGTPSFSEYFPELWLARWFHEQGTETPIYWCFRLSAVAERILYLDAMKTTESYDDVQLAIRIFREGCEQVRPRQAIHG